MLHAVKNGRTVLYKEDVRPVGKHLSMEDVLAFKDVKGTLSVRENLRKKILGNM